MNDKQSRFKKGDIVANGWMSNNNPYYLTMYLKCGKVRTQKTFDCIAYDGRVIRHCQENNKLTVVGHMKEFDDFVNALKKLDRRSPRGERGLKHDNKELLSYAE